MTIRHKMAVVGLTLALSLGSLPSLAYATPSQADLDAAKSTLDELGGQLSELEGELSTQENELQKTQSAIDKKQTEIDRTTEDLSEARSALSARMRSIYKTGSSSLLSVVLGSSSPEEIVSNIYIADKIADQDAQAIATVQDLEQQLSTEMTDLQVHKDKQEDTLAATQKKADAYTAKVDEARRTYESLDSQVQQALAEQAAAEAEAAAQAAAQGEEVEQQSNQSIVISAIEDTPAPEAETTPETATTPADTPSSGGTKTSTQTKTSETTDTPAKTKTPSKETTTTKKSTSQSSSSPQSSSSNNYSGGGLGSAYAAIGSPYVSGATGPDSFDCSGLVCWCYGYDRGRTTYDMIASLKATGDWRTKESDLQVGDLVFTSAGHVGIYTGNHTMIDAPYPGRTVVQRTIWTTIIGGGTY